MAISFLPSERFHEQESPTTRKFQNLVDRINKHILRRGSDSADPHPFQHDSKSAWWDNGLNGGMSVYEKLLERSRATQASKKAATAIISHTPDREADSEIFGLFLSMVCNGSNDVEIIQTLAEKVTQNRSGHLFFKHGNYQIGSPIFLNIPPNLGRKAGTTLLLDGEIGASLTCGVDPTLGVGALNINLQGQENYLNRVVFRNLAWFQEARMASTMVRINVSRRAPSMVVFDGCTFTYGESGYIIEVLGTNSGSDPVFPRIIFRNCFFRKVRGNYYSSAIFVNRAESVDFIGCNFYDLLTAEDPNSSSFWTKTPYIPHKFPSSSDFVLESRAGVPVTNGSSSSDLTVVSGEQIVLQNTAIARFIGCEFKHYDTMIGFRGEGIGRSSLFLQDNIFYQLGAFLASTGDLSGTPVRALISVGNCSVAALNNVFVGAMKAQVGAWSGAPLSIPIFPIIAAGDPSSYAITFCYNYAMVPLSATGTTTPNFVSTISPTLKQFRIWKGFDDRTVLGYPLTIPATQGAGLDDSITTDNQDFVDPYRAIEVDEFGRPLVQLPWCVPRS